MAKRLNNNSIYFTEEGAKGLLLRARIILMMRGQTLKELSSILYIAPSTIYSWIQNNRVPTKTAIVQLHMWLNESENLKVWKQVRDTLGDELSSEAQALLPKKQELIEQGNGRWLVVKK